MLPTISNLNLLPIVIDHKDSLQHLKFIEDFVFQIQRQDLFQDYEPLFQDYQRFFWHHHIPFFVHETTTLIHLLNLLVPHYKPWGPKYLRYNHDLQKLQLVLVQLLQSVVEKLPQTGFHYNACRKHQVKFSLRQLVLKGHYGAPFMLSDLCFTWKHSFCMLQHLT
jgi:hypothetical protein